MRMFYAGIGARKTPKEVLAKMELAAMNLAVAGVSLRTGGAVGADQAFEVGCRAVRGPCEVFKPLDCPDWFEHAATYHPNWAACSMTAMRLHARNSAIMLGAQLNAPVNFVVCWTPGGKVTGGTGQALRIAEAYRVPVFNMYYGNAIDELERYLGVKLQ